MRLLRESFRMLLEGTLTAVPGSEVIDQLVEQAQSPPSRGPHRSGHVCSVPGGQLAHDSPGTPRSGPRTISPTAVTEVATSFSRSWRRKPDTVVMVSRVAGGSGGTRVVLGSAAVAALGGLLFGYDTGIISAALLFITPEFELSATGQQVVVGSLLLGAVLGVLVGGPAGDAIGRRRALLWAAALLPSSSLLQELVLLRPRLAYPVPGPAKHRRLKQPRAGTPAIHANEGKETAMAQLVRELMTPDPVALPADTPVRQAAVAMRDQDIGDVLVVDENQLRGLVTDRDIVVRGLADRDDLSDCLLRDVCSEHLVIATPDEEADLAITRMRDNAVRRIPVVDGGRPVGVFSLGDAAVERDSRSALADISAAEGNT